MTWQMTLIERQQRAKAISEELDNGKTIKEVALSYSLSRERIRQIKAKYERINRYRATFAEVRRIRESRLGEK